jgi:alkaline phosphatase D
MSFKISRRELLQKFLASFGTLSLPISLTACGGDSDDTQPIVKPEFLYGVANGDPLQGKVILWTRLTPNDVSARLALTWEIAIDSEFKNFIHSGKVQTL